MPQVPVNNPVYGTLRLVISFREVGVRLFLLNIVTQYTIYKILASNTIPAIECAPACFTLKPLYKAPRAIFDDRRRAAEKAFFLPYYLKVAKGTNNQRLTRLLPTETPIKPKILISDGVLFLGIKVGMKALNCGEANINTLCISSLEIVNFLYIDTIPVYEYLLGKQVLR